jgi:predicted dehydrogenase
VQASFTLQHESGAVSSCLSSLRAASPCELTISGDKGYVRLNSRFHYTNSITVGLLDGSKTELHIPRSGNGYPHEAAEVVRCLRAGLLESPVMPLDESVALMGILDTMRAQIGVRYSADGQR